ncbi:MAG TPA: hypothetical protein P5102_17655, partial [Candidatus Competibacteraceae bacterium]|nr:hypothetical protein [Candidatus Competibacteraceae bacterium]HRZ07933.1 hypothetical protein [Candidatus Competibacteraceae bacterium]HSA48236.1 hypothetical protein [Candidatus Competibacteraceae bacterium]
NYDWLQIRRRSQENLQEDQFQDFTKFGKLFTGNRLIIQANSARDKQADLLRLRERLEALLVLMRLAKEVRAFKSFNAYVHAVEIVGSVSRQNEGWLRSVAKR